MEMENDFSNVKVGDKVFHILHGWGEVTMIDNERYTPKYFRVRFEGIAESLSFWKNGRGTMCDKNPSVFWDEVKIFTPPKPKRIVEKTIEGWINIYPYSEDDIDIVAKSCNLYKSSKLADQLALIEKRIGDAYHVIHRYIIEE